MMDFTCVCVGGKGGGGFYAGIMVDYRKRFQFMFRWDQGGKNMVCRHWAEATEWPDKRMEVVSLFPHLHLPFSLFGFSFPFSPFPFPLHTPNLTPPKLEIPRSGFIVYELVARAPRKPWMAERRHCVSARGGGAQDARPSAHCSMSAERSRAAEHYESNRCRISS